MGEYEPTKSNDTGPVNTGSEIDDTGMASMKAPAYDFTDGADEDEGTGLASEKAPAYEFTSDEEKPDLYGEEFPWVGKIVNYAAMRNAPNKDANTTLADIPIGTEVHVQSAVGNWLKVSLDYSNVGLILNQKGKESINHSIVTGFVSRELIQSVTKQRNYSQELPYADTGKMMSFDPESPIGVQNEIEAPKGQEEFNLDQSSFKDDTISRILARVYGTSLAQTQASIFFNINFGLVGEILAGLGEVEGGIKVGVLVQGGIGDTRKFKAGASLSVSAYGRLGVLWGLAEGNAATGKTWSLSVATTTMADFALWLIKTVNDEVYLMAKKIHDDTPGDHLASTVHLQSLLRKIEFDSKNPDPIPHTIISGEKRTDSLGFSAMRSIFKNENEWNYEKLNFESGNKSRKATIQSMTKKLQLTLPKNLSISYSETIQKVHNHASSDMDGEYKDHVFDLGGKFDLGSVKLLSDKVQGSKTPAGVLSVIRKFFTDIAKPKEKVFSTKNFAKTNLKLVMSYGKEGSSFVLLNTKIIEAKGIQNEGEGTLPLGNVLLASIHGKMGYELGGQFENVRAEYLGTDTISYISLVHNGIMSRGDEKISKNMWYAFKGKNRRAFQEIIANIQAGEIDISKHVDTSFNLADFTENDLENILDTMHKKQKEKSM